MNSRFTDVTAAELIKLRTLPAVAGTIGATLLGVPGLALVLQAAAPEPAGASAATDAGFQAIEYGQVGLILLGVLAAATEYSGRQIHTTVKSVPHRPLLAAGKAVAHLVTAAMTAVLAVGALAGVGERRPSFGPLLGAVAYLLLISMLAYTVALLTRGVLAALVVMLGLVFVASPLLTRVTAMAGYLPDRAGRQMYQTGSSYDTTLTAGQGGVLMALWVALALALATVMFIRRDA
ncbi:hypothetical protein Q3W71_01010 [Micromonospora sp. C28SCA-DRY-2]|uniref:hypothetical protein n=1 Tax=Micromonospora sp. C28SCA-DRY-2 TaxID=3059522 RepID=UPI0026763605|nr:hypothetical protein [Micromonospora sp. C28SCA-DRY-2]MDO3700260.1 hypothetical protein [Micromonospora sp. C28SCA-DRY-2]